MSWTFRDEEHCTYNEDFLDNLTAAPSAQPSMRDDVPNEDIPSEFKVPVTREPASGIGARIWDFIKKFFEN